MKYVGDKKDLTSFMLHEITNDLWVIKMGDKIYAGHEGNRSTYNSYNKAKGVLTRVMGANFHHAHYWHKDKNNTFSKEGSYIKEGGWISQGDYKKIAKEFTNQLLEDKIFVIEKIT